MFETTLDRHVSSMIGEITAIAQELKYYRGVAHEQTEIIKQLSGQPTEGGVQYIHPSDLSILMSAIKAHRYWFEYRDGEIFQNDSIDGVRYKQSTFMPVYFKGILR